MRAVVLSRFRSEPPRGGKLSRGDLALLVRTTRAMDSEATARRVLAALAHHGDRWIPHRMGTEEPLRSPFNADGFADLWSRRENPSADRGGVLFRSSGELRCTGSVEWRRAWNHSFNSIALRVPAERASEEVLQTFLLLALELASLLDAEHACIRTSEEFESQHRPRGQGAYLGVDLASHVPGIYWVNYFGPTLVRFFGLELLLTCPTWRTWQAGAGVVIQTADSPSQWNSSDALRTKARVRAHLGERTIFDVSCPRRSTIAPTYDLSQVRVGAPPQGVAASSPAGHFFADEAAAREFLDGAPTRCRAFSESIGSSSALDLSPASLSLVDAMVTSPKTERNPDDQAFTLDITAYYGEVIRRNLGGSWTIASDDSRLPVIVLPTGEVEYPLVRALKLLDGGDTLREWYDFVAAGGTRRLRAALSRP